MRETLIKMKKAADVTLAEEVGRNWSEICSHEYLFDRHEKEIQLLESYVTKERVSEVIKTLKERKLSVRIVGNAKLNAEGDGSEEEAVPEEEGEDDPSKVFELKCVKKGNNMWEIGDVAEFNKGLKVHPVVHIN
jgi:hypothetical protein